MAADIRTEIQQKISSFKTIFQRHFILFKATDESGEEFYNSLKPNIDNRQVPMVCLVIRGDLSSIDAIELKIKKEWDISNTQSVKKKQ